MRKVLSVFIAVCLVLSLFTGVFVSMPSARALTEGDYTYDLNGTIPETATITGYVGIGGAVVIPATLGTSPAYPVTTLGNGAFNSAQGHLLTGVTMPNSVTSIGDSVFQDCAALTSVTIGSGVAYIGNTAFWRCTALTSVTIPDSVTSIANNAFQGCSALTSLTIGSGLTSIGYAVFSSCTKLTSVIIPNSVTSIGNYAFYGCAALASVTIPSGVTSIGAYTFHGCAALASVTIPNSVTSIGANAFQGCTALASVTIPDGVSSIKDYTFYNCPALTGLVIPDSVESIGYWAFRSCMGLLSVTIGSGVTTIGASAFAWCEKLTAAYFLGNAPAMGADGFASCAPEFTVWHIDGNAGWTNPWYTYPTATFSAAAILSASWNLVSVPISLPVVSIAGLQSVFGYHDGWSVPTTLTPGDAYWVQVENAVTVPLYGTPSTLPVPITYQEGWQLLGNPFDVPVPITSITNHGLITTCYSYGSIWGILNPATDSLQPGKGYWIQLSAPATLTLTRP